MPPILSTVEVVCALLACAANAADPMSLFKDSALQRAAKCCAPGARLLVGDNSTRCSKPRVFDAHHFDIVAPVISPFATDGVCAADLDCVDSALHAGTWRLVGVRGARCERREIPAFSYAPKCCPPAFAYDARTHACVSDARAPSADDDLQVVKIGLADCPVYSHAVVDFEERFDIEMGTKRLRLGGGASFNFGEYCIERESDARTYLARACLRSDVACAQRRCLWKCCPDGEVYVQTQRASKKRCAPSANAEINLEAISTNVIERQADNKFAVISANLSMGYRLYKHRESMTFKVNEDGEVETMIDHAMRYYDSTSMVYCIEQLQTPNSTTQAIYMFQIDVEDTPEIFKSIVLFTSAVFATLTIVCYALLPEMQNLHGKCIMMECFFLALGSLILCYTKVFSVSQSTLCTALAYGTIFAFLGLFAWLNIICVDMWLTFGVLRVFKVKDRRSELKKFFLYSLYGFGVPTLFVSCAIFAQHTNLLPESIRPKIGNRQCYFDDDSGMDCMLYFLLPMSAMLLINVVLFIKTILYCIKVKNEIERMRDGSGNEMSKWKRTLNADKEKMVMLLKLFLIMGIPWLFEMVSSFASFKKYWPSRWLENVIDTINCAKGIIIFCIFILKRSVLNLLARKFGMKTAPTRSTELTSLTLT